MRADWRPHFDSPLDTYASYNSGYRNLKLREPLGSFENLQEVCKIYEKNMSFNLSLLNVNKKTKFNAVLNLLEMLKNCG